jgi:hypothetical protein
MLCTPAANSWRVGLTHTTEHDPHVCADDLHNPTDDLLPSVQKRTSLFSCAAVVLTLQDPCLLLRRVQEGMVFYDIELSEPTPTTARFSVSADRSKLVLVDPTPPLSNGNFTSLSGPNKFKGWTMQQAPGVRTFSDQDVSHAGSGGSMRIESLGGEFPSARVMQQFPASPNGSVTAQCWVKGDMLDLGTVDLRMQLNFDGDDNCGRWEAPDIKRSCVGHATNCSFGWQAARVTCGNIDDHTALQLWLGLWGNSSRPGSVWFTGCELFAGGGVVNVLRRVGAPLTVRGVGPGGGTTYTEGMDYDPIPSTPQVSTHPISRLGAFYFTR